MTDPIKKKRTPFDVKTPGEPIKSEALELARKATQNIQMFDATERYQSNIRKITAALRILHDIFEGSLGSDALPVEQSRLWKEPKEVYFDMCDVMRALSVEVQS